MPIATAMSIKKSALVAPAWQRPSVRRPLPAVKRQGIQRRALRLAPSAPCLRTLVSAALPCLLARCAGLRRVHFGLWSSSGRSPRRYRLHSYYPSPNTALHVTGIAWSLTQQDHSAWSFEVQARPFGEKW